MQSKIPLKDIDQPSHLLTAFPHHTLTISSKAHASQRWSTEVKDCTLPDGEVYLRFEPDVNKIFVDLQLFKWLNAPELSKKLRDNTQYCGVKSKRMMRGVKTITMTPVKSVLVFDLNKISAVRASAQREEQRARKRPVDHVDRSLDIIKHAETVFDRAYAAYKRVEKQLAEVNREINNPANASMPKFWFDTKREMRSLLEQSFFILDIGKNLHAEVVDLAHRYNTPLRRTSKRIKRNNPYAPKDVPRTRILAFEKMIEIEAQFIHRQRYYWSDKTGFLKEHLKEYIPENTDPAFFSGYYREWSHSDGTGMQKWLWVPVALLNTYSHKDSTILTPEEKESLKFYRTDVRYVSTEVKRIGGKAHRCAKFDMRRTVNPAREEPQREPEKNKYKD